MKRLALILYFLIPLASADEDAEIKRDIKIYDRLLNSTYGLFPHKSTYLLPFSYNATPTHKIYRPLTSDRKDRNKPDY